MRPRSPPSPPSQGGERSKRRTLFFSPLAKGGPTPEGWGAGGSPGISPRAQESGARAALSTDHLLLTTLVLAPFLVIMLLGSMLPAIDFDVLEYHLQGPKEYYQAGRISFLPHNVYTSMPFGVEMLHLLGMEVLGDWWWGGLVGQFLVGAYAPAAAVLVAGAAGRAAGPTAAWFAAIVYLSTPWIYRLAVISYVEGPLCYYHAALLWAAVLGWTDRTLARGPLWGLLGLLAGGAMACKYPALISAVIPFGLLALADCWRCRSARPLVAYVLGWSIVMGPWLLKNVVTRATRFILWAIVSSEPGTGTRHGSFSGRTPWSPPANLESLWSSLVDVAGRSDWQSPLYVAFAPLAFLRPGSENWCWLWAATRSISS